MKMMTKIGSSEIISDSLEEYDIGFGKILIPTSFKLTVHQF